ncbi:MAG: GNAT family N-acetyltransferase [Succinivibrionaceae bacterium]|nr:GNAT family N-acetyltransferase [Succinivibrionaceae bacterium]
MDSETELRWAQDSDCGAIARVELDSAEYECRREPIGLGVVEFATVWRGRLSSGTHKVVVCCRGESLLGFISLAQSIDQGYINALYVAPESMRQGVGQRLVNQAADLVRAHGGTRLIAEVEPLNEGGARFYENLGFFRVRQLPSGLILFFKSLQGVFRA